MHRPTLFPVPAFALKLGLGREMGTELVLFGQRAQAEALTASGFTFGATDVATGLQQVLAKS
jgi:NAD dependent epimerase/dehydratase family enzyme